MKEFSDFSSLSSTGTEQTLFYFPHYGDVSPYQKLLYEDMKQTRVCPGSAEEALACQQTAAQAGTAPVVLHLHWLAAVLAEADSQTQAEALRLAFRETLTRFVHLGGIVLWTVHSDALTQGRWVSGVGRQLCQDVAHLALRVHVHTPRVLRGLCDVIDLDPNKALVQPLELGRIGPVLEQVIAEGYCLSGIQIATDAGPQGCVLSGRVFPPARIARTAVVILNYKSTGDTRRLIRSLRGSEDQDFDLYVVDNCSPEFSSFEASVFFAGAHVLRSSSNLGYATGNNMALRMIAPLGYAFVWILNPDMEVTPQALTQHVAAATEYPDVSIFGPALRRGSDRNRVASAGCHVSFEGALKTGHLYAGRQIETLPEAPYEADFITGAAMFFRTKVIEDIGYLPEDYFLYFEETQWLLEAGHKGVNCLVLPHILLTHHQASQENGLPAVYYLYYYLRNAVLFYKRMGDVDPASTISALRSGFIANWLARTVDIAPEHSTFYGALTDQALADGEAGVTGRIDLEALEADLRRQS